MPRQMMIVRTKLMPIRVVLPPIWSEMGELLSTGFMFLGGVAAMSMDMTCG